MTLRDAGKRCALTGERPVQGPEPTPAAFAPIRPSQRLDALTTMRIVPALYVLAFHYATTFFPAAPLPAGLSLGYSGVTFFFVLSGFILSHTYASVDFGDGRALRRYAMARVARIAPVYLLAIAVSLPFFLLAVLPFRSGLAALATLVRVALTVLGLHAWLPGAACALDCPSWSVSTEVFFYALFPFLLPLIVRRPRAWCAGTAGALLAIWCAGGLVWARFGQGLPLTAPATHDRVTTNLVGQFLMYWPPLRLPEFVGGLLLAVAFRRCGGRPSPALIGLAGVGALAILALRPWVPDLVLHNGLTALVWAPLILVGAGLGPGVLSWAPLLLLGRISYALYLLHVPTAEAVLFADRTWFDGAIAAAPLPAALGTTALALLLSTATFFLVEEPARDALKRRWARSAQVLRVVPSGVA